MDYDVTNVYLENAINELVNNENNQDAVNNFIFELKVSNLLMPTMVEGEEVVYETLISDDEESAYLPLFTSKEEFYKYYAHDSEYTPMDNEFETYSAIVEEDDIDGIIINVESMSFAVPREIIEFAQADFSISFDEIETRPIAQIREVYENASNEDLVQFIRDESNADNFEGLMAELSFSNVLNLVVSEEPLDGFANDGVIEGIDVGGFSLCTVETDDSCYAVMFTDREALLKVTEDDDINFYGQLTKISELFDFVLRNDMDGVIINPLIDDYLIPRSVILSQASGIELIAEDASFRNCLDYAFLL